MSVKLRDAIRAINRSAVASMGALTLVGISGTAAAQEPMLEEIVVTAI